MIVCLLAEVFRRFHVCLHTSSAKRILSPLYERIRHYPQQTIDRTFLLCPGAKSSTEKALRDDPAEEEGYLQTLQGEKAPVARERGGDIIVELMNTTPLYQARIVRIPGLVGGKPVIKGTRIPVWLVLEYLAEDPNINTLFEAFPRLTIEDVKACLNYAKDLVEEEEILPPVEKEPHYSHV